MFSLSFAVSSPFSPSVNSCLLLFSSDGVSCLSASPLSRSLTFSLSRPLFTLLVCLSPSEGDSAQRHTGTDWRLTLAVVLFMEAENYTFPAFLLEIRSRSGLSIQDRDPGGGETGCCYNHFLHHHFLQVD